MDTLPDVDIPITELPLTRIGAIVTVQVRGVEYRARITGVSDGKARVHLFEQLQKPSESALAITLIQALPKKEKMELIIQKATELGVCAVFSCVSARSITLAERARDQDKTHRWKAVAAKAAEQSRRRIVPGIEWCDDLASALAKASNADLKLMLYEKEASMNLRSLEVRDVSSIALVAGPDGGFTDEEVALARMRGYIPVRLGARVLRCETASIAAIAIAQFLWGDL